MHNQKLSSPCQSLRVITQYKCSPIPRPTFSGSKGTLLRYSNARHRERATTMLIVAPPSQSDDCAQGTITKECLIVRDITFVEISLPPGPKIGHRIPCTLHVLRSLMLDDRVIIRIARHRVPDMCASPLKIALAHHNILIARATLTLNAMPGGTKAERDSRVWYSARSSSIPLRPKSPTTS